MKFPQPQPNRTVSYQQLEPHIAQSCNGDPACMTALRGIFLQESNGGKAVTGKFKNIQNAPHGPYHIIGSNAVAAGIDPYDPAQATQWAAQNWLKAKDRFGAPGWATLNHNLGPSATAKVFKAAGGDITKATPDLIRSIVGNNYGDPNYLQNVAHRLAKADVDASDGRATAAPPASDLYAKALTDSYQQASAINPLSAGVGAAKARPAIDLNRVSKQLDMQKVDAARLPSLAQNAPPAPSLSSPLPNLGVNYTPPSLTAGVVNTYSFDPASTPGRASSIWKKIRALF